MLPVSDLDGFDDIVLDENSSLGLLGDRLPSFHKARNGTRLFLIARNPSHHSILRRYIAVFSSLLHYV